MNEKHKEEFRLSPQNSSIDKALIAAYKSTNYKIFGNFNFTLNIDIPSTELLNLYKCLNINCAAFITAFNPYSRTLNGIENEHRQLALINEIKEKGFCSLNGIGQSSSGDWPGETSVLVFGLKIDDAKLFGNKFEQNAIVWCDWDAIPRIILLK